jgi:putative oxidoreductase
VIELVAGLLIAIGLFTRAAAFIASGEMAVAYFWVHQPRSLWPIGDPPGGNGGTLAILFCFGFLLLVFTGPGIFSIDTRRRGAKKP